MTVKTSQAKEERLQREKAKKDADKKHKVSESVNESVSESVNYGFGERWE